MSISRRSFLEWTLHAAGAATLVGCAGPPAGSGATPPPAAPGSGEPDPGGAEAAPASAPETSTSSPTLLILGGTGFLGPHLVEQARARGFEITLFNRGKTNPHLFPGLEKLRGDRDGDLEALKGRSWDAVIDTSGYVPRIVTASAELLASAVKHYTFISTLSVYADHATVGITEEYPVATIEDESNEDVRANYGALKALCERAAEAAMPGRVANIRPGLIVGPLDPTDRFTYWPVRVARGGEVLAPGTGDDRIQVIDVRDLAAWTVQVVEQRVTGVYNAVGPAGGVPMRSVLERCRQALGSDARFTWVSAEFLEAQEVAPWQHMPAWLPAEGEYAGFGSVDVSRAVARGLSFRPIEDTARATVEWFQTLPAERQAKLRAGITPEREAEVLAAWHARG
ncbi:NAD-dependent epimerase/dehydratase family protein [Haliangium sp.]|uniref:NAD-dependent epimerase/dehydratase family protein n=1 Tax=Haliangium sp. TaxID=2663208 RepID=UPI003D11A4BB